ncbi:MAG: hypothetical protein A2Y31_11665 [Spirochaetes bacterium GWC2_52_13]|nr:MAG: hypothetical protein A2Y31_11665 [Spirochaetes bacterium GWC2_52_13]
MRTFLFHLGLAPTVVMIFTGFTFGYPLIAKRSERKGTMEWTTLPSECRQRKDLYLALGAE